MAKDALTVLREARELISDPKRWTQGEYARDIDGHEADYDLYEAVCFCAVGAVSRVKDLPDGPGLSPYIQPLVAPAASLVHGTAFEDDLRNPIVIVNDELGHEAVLRMFDAAIAAEEAGAR